MYTAAKNSKMPQCFACIRGVWGFIDRVTGLTHLRKARHGLHESNTGRQLSPLPWILRILCRILVSLHTKARNPQEPGRGRLRPREAQLGAHEESHGRQDSGRIAPGSPHINDLERAHCVLVREGGLGSEAHRADVNDPVYLELMEMVNDLCSWLKRYLWRFTGMSPRNLQAHLDWYVYLFRVNLARNRWDPTARVVRHILMTDATYRSLGQVRHRPLSKLLDLTNRKSRQDV